MTQRPGDVTSMMAYLTRKLVALPLILARRLLPDLRAARLLPGDPARIMAGRRRRRTRSTACARVSASTSLS